MLYEKYGRLMHYRARQIVGDEYLAQDAVQDAMIRLCRYTDKLGEINSKAAKTYIMAVLECTVRNIVGSRTKEGLSINDECFDVTDPNDLEYEITHFIDMRAAYDKTKYLSDSNWQMLHLRYIDEMSLKEIASLYEISVDAVSKRIGRARNKLKDIIVNDLNDYQYDD
ncbi:MAG: sigma-70 family RNA polymerase sigma factor [Eubacteriales bacterium]|nr:sigma-70 family RNA polymerase sigma factor [Eubacteriales bacterium]MDD4327701.1 sigma-70 family RNA polymerase sigma factor [Eubacteriales bacterium]MDD4717943.1 sigma-70 family RNA polymerase sigma factor [Eubacteriales bacterium]